jgi:hypothetical protein
MLCEDRKRSFDQGFRPDLLSFSPFCTLLVAEAIPFSVRNLPRHLFSEWRSGATRVKERAIIFGRPGRQID